MVDSTIRPRLANSKAQQMAERDDRRQKAAVGDLKMVKEVVRSGLKGMLLDYDVSSLLMLIDVILHYPLRLVNRIDVVLKVWDSSYYRPSAFWYSGGTFAEWCSEFYKGVSIPKALTCYIACHFRTGAKARTSPLMVFIFQHTPLPFQTKAQTLAANPSAPLKFLLSMTRYRYTHLMGP